MPKKNKFVRFGVEYTSVREYYNAVERGEAKDDFGNPFLMHFGFNYWGDLNKGVESYEVSKYYSNGASLPKGSGKRSSE